MTRKIGIIGVGHVGAAIAHALVVEGVADELVLIDTNEQKLTAEVVDLQDAAANLGSNHTKILQGYEQLADADVVFSTIGNVAASLELGDRNAEVKINGKMVATVGTSIKEAGFKGTLIVISNPVDAIASLYQKYIGLPSQRVIGTGTLLDSARMKRIVGELFGVDPRSVSGYVLGEHGDAQLTAWSTVRVHNQPIIELAKQRGLDLVALEQSVRTGGMVVGFGKGFTSYGIATAGIRLAKAVLSDAHEELVVSSYSATYDLFISYPAIVGRAGIVELLDLNLLPEELAKFAKSAASIRTNITAIEALLSK
ncbi:MAG: L-lactate dehydrogenase [Lactobacillaceae bacterium]|jgi:L-lactate dehydrogenase|nr:L-lactate dehydrogenase [Lactobacillaceae bacterium]